MRVAVVGGGLAGLVAATDLVATGTEVTIFEPAAFGGQIRTRREAGFVVEDGAEGWVASDPDLQQLCSMLGLTEQIISQQQLRSHLYTAGQLSELRPGHAAGLLGIQAKDTDLGRGIVSLRDGTGSLVEALVRQIASRASLGGSESVGSIDKDGSSLAVITDSGDRFVVDAAVLAVPAATAGGLLEPHAPDAARELRAIEHASNVSVSLAWNRSDVSHPLDASGVVIETNLDLEGLRACAFSSSKLPNRAPADKVLLRAFFRPTEATIDESDDAWRERAVRLMGPVLGLAGAPLGAWVARWHHALPQYGKDHGQVIARVAAAFREIGRVSLAGAVYAPGGIPGAVRSGRAAAREVLEA